MTLSAMILPSENTNLNFRIKNSVVETFYLQIKC